MRSFRLMILGSLVLGLVVPAVRAESHSESKDASPAPSAAASAAPAGDAETLDQGSDAGKMTEHQIVVIQTGDAFKDLWQKMHANQTPVPPPPEVDWTKHQVVAAFGGQQSTGGYEVKLKSATPDAAGFKVEVELVAPPADAMTTDQITSPYLLLKVPAGKTVATAWTGGK